MTDVEAAVLTNVLFTVPSAESALVLFFLCTVTSDHENDSYIFYCVCVLVEDHLCHTWNIWVLTFHTFENILSVWENDLLVALIVKQCDAFTVPCEWQYDPASCFVTMLLFIVVNQRIKIINQGWLIISLFCLLSHCSTFCAAALKEMVDFMSLRSCSRHFVLSLDLKEEQLTSWHSCWRTGSWISENGIF